MQSNLDATDLTKATTETQSSGPESYDVCSTVPSLFVSLLQHASLSCRLRLRGKIRPLCVVDNGVPLSFLSIS